MAQLVLAIARDDGDYDTIVAIQNDDNVAEIPALEWILQMKEFMESGDEGLKCVILHRDVLIDVIVDSKAEDITSLCEEAFNGGQPWV